MSKQKRVLLGDRDMRHVSWMLLIGLLACGNETRTPPFLTTIDTLDGVVHVVNSGDPPTWELRLMVTVGSEDEGPDAFGNVTSVLLDDSGYVYVADRQAQQIQVFGLDGAYRRTIGRQGSGPGEFRDLVSIAWVGDTLAGLDWRNARIGLFNRAGEWLGLWRSQSFTGANVRLYRTSPTHVHGIVARRAGDNLEAVYVEYSAAGPGDSVPTPKHEWTGPRGPLCRLADNGGISFFDIPFGSQFMHSPAPGGTIATVITAQYKIAFLAATGDTVRVVEREYVNLPITDAEWEDGTAYYREFLDTWGKGSSCEPKTLERPGAKPAIRSLMFDPDGRMWVESYSDSGFAFDVFDDSGRLQASVPAPPRHVRVEPYVRNGRLVLVERDSLDVQYVKVFEIAN